MRKGWQSVENETQAFDTTELNIGPLLNLATIQYDENRFVGRVNNSWWPEGEFKTVDEAQKASEELAQDLFNQTLAANNKRETRINRFLNMSFSDFSICFIGLFCMPAMFAGFLGRWWGIFPGLMLGIWSLHSVFRKKR